MPKVKEFKDKLRLAERMLEQDRLIEVRDMLLGLKSTDEYQSTGQRHLVDYLLAQSLFCIGLNTNQLSVAQLNEVIGLVRDSIRANPQFPDSYVLMGHSYMARSRYETKEQFEISARKALHNFSRARDLDSALEDLAKGEIKNVTDRLGYDPNQTIPYLVLCDIDEKLIEELKNQFNGKNRVQILLGNLLEQEGDAVVSPANSYGFMDGGLDFLLCDYFGESIQERVQKAIREKHDGVLSVGNAEIVETRDERFPYLICAPTMYVPQALGKSLNPYMAVKAVFSAVVEFNKHNQTKINLICMSGLGTGVGKMPADVVSKQIRIAYEHFAERKFNAPRKTGDIIRFYNLLSAN